MSRLAHILASLLPSAAGIVALLFSCTLPLTAWGWGDDGHRISAIIAESYLTPSSKAAIAQLLPGEPMSRIATYADRMRSHPSTFWKRTASPWHYVTVPRAPYRPGSAPAEGDAYTALTQFSKQLKDPGSSAAEKQLALRFIVHLVADLHQPLHAGNGKDRGGNQIKLRFKGRDTNLHRLWDSDLIKGFNEPFWISAKRLQQQITSAEVAQWKSSDPSVWINESANYRDRIYPDSNSIRADYESAHLNLLEQRLQQAGVRIAVYLNEMFKP